MMIDNTKTLERIKQLTELHGAPGFEDEVRDYMKQEMAPMLMNLFKITWVEFMELRNLNKAMPLK